MRPHLATLTFCLSALAGCEDVGLAGSWLGECSLLTMEEGADIGFAMELSEDPDWGIVGQGSFAWEAWAFAGDVSGERMGRNVDLLLTGFQEEYSMGLEVAGELEQGDAIVGTCQVNGFPGLLWMHR
jgi:hypothetical protein